MLCTLNAVFLSLLLHCGLQESIKLQESIFHLLYMCISAAAHNWHYYVKKDRSLYIYGLAGSFACLWVCLFVSLFVSSPAATALDSLFCFLLCEFRTNFGFAKSKVIKRSKNIFFTRSLGKNDLVPNNGSHQIVWTSLPRSSSLSCHVVLKSYFF